MVIQRCGIDASLAPKTKRMKGMCVKQRQKFGNFHQRCIHFDLGLKMHRGKVENYPVDLWVIIISLFSESLA